MLIMATTTFMSQISLATISESEQHIIWIICTKHHAFMTKWSIRPFLKHVSAGLHTHGNVTYTHDNMAYTHGNMAYTHDYMAYTHGNMAYTHGNMTYTHGNKAYTHGNMAYTHGNMAYTHGNMAYTPPTVRFLNMRWTWLYAEHRHNWVHRHGNRVVYVTPISGLRPHIFQLSAPH